MLPVCTPLSPQVYPGGFRRCKPTGGSVYPKDRRWISNPSLKRKFVTVQGEFYKIIDVVWRKTCFLPCLWQMLDTVNSDIKASMFEYYNERAKEYEELYTLGKGPASIPDPEAYKREVNILAGIAGEFCYGSVIDIACGTGFWLPYYVRQCSQVTLIDQSAKMLSVCKEKVSSLEVQDKCNLVCDDFLAHQFNVANFDCALMGFFISHLSQKEEQEFFEKLKSILKPSGKFLIFDSTWNEERARTREKQGKHQRKLNNGRAFDIYKRYFEKDDIIRMGKQYRLTLSLGHVGRIFIAATGKLK